MRIVHVYRDVLVPGGVPHQTRQLIEAQVASGDEVLAICARPREVPVIPAAIETLQLDSTVSARHIRAAVRRFAPDIVHTSSLGIPIQHLWLCATRRIDVPHVLSPHGLLSPAGLKVRFGGKRRMPPITWAKRVVHRVVDLPFLRSVDAVHAQAPYEAELAAAKGATATFVAPAGIDREWVNVAVADSRRLTRPVTFTYLGRLDVHHKSLDMVISAVRMLKHRESDFRVVLAGEAVRGSVAVLHSLVRASGICNVELRGPAWADDKTALWRESDYFLGAFRYAGMARATGEALGHGLPVIASRECNWGDWVRDWKLGFCTDLTSRDIADSLESAMALDAAAYKTFTDAATSFATHYSWSQVAAETAAAYRGIIAGRPELRRPDGVQQSTRS